MEGNSSTTTSLLIQAEKKYYDQAYIGSYATLATPNFVSVHLKRKKNNIAKKSKDHDIPRSDSNVIKSLKVNENETETFHTKKDEQQLYRQAREVLDDIAVKSRSAIIGHTVKANKQCLRRVLFICQNWPAGPLPDQSV